MNDSDQARIRIAFVLNSLSIGGAERHVVSLVNRMNCSEFRISLIYLKEDADLLTSLQAQRCEGGVMCLGVRRRGMQWSALKRLAAHLDTEGVDVVVCTNLFSLVYGWLASRLSSRKRPVVEVFHSRETAETRDRLRMILYRPFVRFTDLLVYVCDGQAKYWASRGLRARRERVIRNGIDIRRFTEWPSAEETAAIRARFGFSASDYVVGHCAVMRPDKAHVDLLAAIARLHTEGLDVKCLLIGDGPSRPAIERYIGEHRLSSHVRIAGYELDVRPYVGACDVMVLPSRETFPLASLEAMALGKPMIMTNVGGAPEQVCDGEHGLLFRPGDITDLAKCIERLSDRAEQARMGASAAARVAAEFDLEHMVRSFQDAFRELVRPSSGGVPPEIPCSTPRDEDGASLTQAQAIKPRRGIDQGAPSETYSLSCEHVSRWREGPWKRTA